MAKTKKKKGADTTFLDQEINLEEQYSKAESYINNNKNLILTIVAVIALLLMVVFWFKSIYIPGQEADAQNNMYKAQQYFEVDSFSVALEGDGQYYGFLQIIDEYNGMTNAVNLANYYAGVSYLNLGEYQKAIDYLGNFSSNDKVVASMALGAMGDAYGEMDNLPSAITYYKKAANNSENSLSTPMFLKKAGMALEVEGKYKDAKGLYEQIKRDFPDSAEGREIDKYITRAELKL